MCGIAGFYSEKQQPESGLQLLDKMLESISHRGPDYRGVLNDGAIYLGHNRLSIIDLSAEANQPMERDNLVIIFNGEIYNYLEVREDLVKRGHHFKTSSDTEVILAAYQEWGTGCTDRFLGMWAFAIWDRTTKKIFCSRDRFGIKPFYYIFENGEFYFASEYKPLKLVPAFDGRLNFSQVSRGLQLGWVTYKDETYFEKIRELPAAHHLLLENKELRISRYWDIDFTKQIKGSFEEKKERFRELFFDSLRLHLRSDVPVAATLSGGIDSSAIVSGISALYPEQVLNTFSVYYEGKHGVDERPFIKEVVNKYPKNINPVYYTPTEGELKEHFHRALHHADVPATGSSFMSQYFIMKSIAENGIRVVLSGQGADDYLGGYMHSFYRLYADMLRKGKLLGFAKGLLQHKRLQEFSAGKAMSVMAKSIFSTITDEGGLYRYEYKKYFPFLTDDRDDNDVLPEEKGNNRLNAFLYQLMQLSSLPTLLHYEDRNSMAYSIESRVPFLDHRLVEFGFALGNEDKIHHGSTKYILRESMRPELPPAIADRKDKKGFVTPGEVVWLRGPLSYLLEEDMSDLPMIDLQKAKQVLNDFKKGDNRNANLVWRLVVLNYWRKYIA
jgi:asparagine synthase (glutamine-hydrolysing)